MVARWLLPRHLHPGQLEAGSPERRREWLSYKPGVILWRWEVVEKERRR